jgi:transposase
MARFLKILKGKRPIMLSQDRWLCWDNTSVHTTASVGEFLAAEGVKTIPYPPYSHDLAPSDFFLFKWVKPVLAGLMLTKESFKNSWEPSSCGCSYTKSVSGLAATM